MNYCSTCSIPISQEQLKFCRAICCMRLLCSACYEASRGYCKDCDSDDLYYRKEELVEEALWGKFYYAQGVRRCIHFIDIKNSKAASTQRPYKIHIIVPKIREDELWYPWVINNIVKKLLENGINIFKIDRHKRIVPSGEMAFTLYDVDSHTCLGYQTTLCMIDKYISEEIRKLPSNYVLSEHIYDYMVQNVPGLNYIVYRKEIDEYGNYRRDPFDKVWLTDPLNPYTEEMFGSLDIEIIPDNFQYYTPGLSFGVPINVRTLSKPPTGNNHCCCVIQ